MHFGQKFAKETFPTPYIIYIKYSESAATEEFIYVAMSGIFYRYFRIINLFLVKNFIYQFNLCKRI